MAAFLLNSATAILLCISCVLFSLLMYQSNRETQGSRYWAAGIAIFACGLLFLRLPQFTPMWFSIIFANAIMLLGMVLQLAGTLRFFNRTVNWWLLVVTVITASIGMWYFSYIKFDTTARIIIFSITHMAFNTAILITLHYNRGHHYRVAMRLFYLTIGLGLGVLSYRVAVTVAPTFFGGAIAIEIMVQLIMGLPFFICCAMLLGFFLLCNERQYLRIQKLQQQAQQQADSKKKLFAFLSHEFRTPLNAIVGKAELLAKQIADPKVQYECELIAESGKALSLINQQILRQAEVEHAGFTDTSTETIILRQWLTRFIDTYQPFAQSKGLSLQLYVAETAPLQITLNSTALRQILTNLVANAIKYSDSGIIKLSVESEHLGAENIDSRFRFTLTDQGSGIPEAEQQSILQPFSRAWHSMQQEGTGLGLALTQQLLHSIGSELTFTSKAGIGSCFSFSLALTEAFELSVSSLTTTGINTAPIRILVVEDIPLNQQVISGMLDYLSHKYVIASSLAQASQLLQHQHFDLLLLDLNLSDGDGLSFFNEIKNTNFLLPPTCVVTANITLRTEQACLAAGVIAVLHKPIELKKLQQLIAKTTSANLTFDSAQFWQMAKFIPKTSIKLQLEQLDSDFSALLTQLKSLDNKQQSALIHKLAGKAATLGMVKLAKACAKLEQCNADIRGYIPQLQQLSSEAISALKQTISTDL